MLSYFIAIQKGLDYDESERVIISTFSTPFLPRCYIFLVLTKAALKEGARYFPGI